MIWVDGDAAPRAVKEVVFKAASRTKTEVVVVANRWMQLPKSKYVRMHVVEAGFDVADEYIIDHVNEGDLVISADIPLAAAAVEKGALVVDPRGHVIDGDNARQRLAMRDFMETLRESGEQLGGPAPYSEKDKRRFAGVLDRWLAKR